MTPRDQWEALRDALEHVKATEREATDGPWEAVTDGWVETVSGDGEDWCAVRPVGSNSDVMAQMLHGEDCDEQTEADAALIVLLRNAAPALLASARQVVDAHRPAPLGSRCLCAHDPWPCLDVAPLLPLIGGDQ